MPDSFKLLLTPRFRPFFLTQLAGAFNDNLYRIGLSTFIVFQAVGIDQQQSGTLVFIAGGLFILPFFLFSSIGGELADKLEKSMLIRRIKLLEIGIMLLGAAAFALQSPWLLISILFLMGTQSALFGPVKYSLMPQALKPRELVGGNAMVEFGTFLAILLGQIFGVFIIGLGTVQMGIAVVVVAVLGYYLLTIAYIAFIWISIWRSASRYGGWRGWAVIAKTVVVIGGLSMAAGVAVGVTGFGMA